jgi:protein-disulfide isomerase
MTFKIKITRVLRVPILCFLAAGMLFTGPTHADPMAGVLEPKIIPDTFHGEAAAPVTRVVYSSPTCSHCIEFHEDSLRAIEEKYVKRGVLKISMRPFMRNSLDAVIFMIANSRGAGRFDETVSVFMSRMDEISAAGEGTEAAVRKVAGDIGVDRLAFDRAVSNQLYLDQLTRATNEARDLFGVTGTPSFFVNGRQVVLKDSFAEIDQAIDAAAAHR